ncbi:hypothetical protein BDV26DRAFT_258737 [Aspergillus bertholletiae]|uniref:Uncharacterized protein n=1 Tax=Aspergillus bertholletiae TaxID=1226010 RepID=A0A5N7BD84_9EURO|nr:hypothetical protein BDV26DRAFT_258737 [Aspergillus bertholletiae]
MEDAVPLAIVGVMSGRDLRPANDDRAAVVRRTLQYKPGISIKSGIPRRLNGVAVRKLPRLGYDLIGIDTLVVQRAQRRPRTIGTKSYTIRPRLSPSGKSETLGELLSAMLSIYRNATRLGL